MSGETPAVVSAHERIREALAFDDVLLVPGHSEVLPAATDVAVGLAEVHEIMRRHRISGLPVIERADQKLVGILTNRDMRFETDPERRVYELMTRDHLVTVNDGADPEEARQLLHKHRIEKLLVVDRQGRCTGIITAKCWWSTPRTAIRPGCWRRSRGSRRCPTRCR